MTGFQAFNLIWLACLFVPLIIFYFLKLKRPRVEVASLVLWQQVLNDRRVNSPFQRFKKHLLLLLQLLLLTLAILAAMQPFYMAKASAGKRMPILIDTSASMGAMTPEGITRLEQVKRSVRDIIQNKLNEQQYCIISFSNTARKRCGFTDNKRILLDALAKIEIEDVGSGIEDALRMTQALGRSFYFEKVLMFSDGNIPDKINFDLPFMLDYKKIGVPVANTGITGFGATRASENEWQVFVQIDATANSPVAVVKLYANDNLIGEEHFAGGPEARSDRLFFQVSETRSITIKAVLQPRGNDALAADNEAYLFLPVMRPLQVYVSPDLQAVIAVLKGIDNINLTTEKEKTVGYDLLVTNRSDELDDETRTIFFVGIGKPLQPYIQQRKGQSRVIDWKRDEPLLDYVQFNDLLILANPAFKAGINAEKQIGNLGYEVLVDGKNGPLMLKRQWAEQVVFDMLFLPQKSTFPYRIGFPIMLTNLTEVARKQAGLSDINAKRTGVLPDLQLQPNMTCTISAPDKDVFELRTDEHGILSGLAAGKAGVYRIQPQDGEKIKLGASLLNSRETLLASIDKLKFNELDVAASKNKVKTSRNLWPLLASLALAVLILEWWVFNKPIKRFSKAAGK